MEDKEYIGPSSWQFLGLLYAVSHRGRDLMEDVATRAVLVSTAAMIA